MKIKTNRAIIAILIIVLLASLTACLPAPPQLLPPVEPSPSLPSEPVLPPEPISLPEPFMPPDHFLPPDSYAATDENGESGTEPTEPDSTGPGSDMVETTTNGATGSEATSTVDLGALADEVFHLTNVERANAGLPGFSGNTPLTQTAVVRANEIIQHFSHDRPDGRSCFTAFDENEVMYRTAGENLAMGQRTPEEVVRGWMDSPGHRDNILNGDFGNLGVGVTICDDGRLHWAQTFTD